MVGRPVLELELDSTIFSLSRPLLPLDYLDLVRNSLNDLHFEVHFDLAGEVGPFLPHVQILIAFRIVHVQCDALASLPIPLSYAFPPHALFASLPSRRVGPLVSVAYQPPSKPSLIVALRLKKSALF